MVAEEKLLEVQNLIKAAELFEKESGRRSEESRKKQANIQAVIDKLLEDKIVQLGYVYLINNMAVRILERKEATGFRPPGTARKKYDFLCAPLGSKVPDGSMFVGKLLESLEQPEEKSRTDVLADVLIRLGRLEAQIAQLGRAND